MTHHSSFHRAGIVLLLAVLAGCDPEGPVSVSSDFPIGNHITPMTGDAWAPPVTSVNNGRTITVRLPGLCQNLGIPDPGTRGLSMDAGRITDLTMQSEIADQYESHRVLAAYLGGSPVLDAFRDPYNRMMSAEQNTYHLLAKLAWTDPDIAPFFDTLTVRPRTEDEVLTEVFNIPVWISANQATRTRYEEEMVQATDSSLFAFLGQWLADGSIDTFAAIRNAYLQEVRTFARASFDIGGEILAQCSQTLQIRKDKGIIQDVEPATVDIVSARSLSLLNYSVRANADHRGRGLTITVNSTSTAPASVIIPSGMLFTPVGGAAPEGDGAGLTKQCATGVLARLRAATAAMLPTAYQQVMTSSGRVITINTPSGPEWAKVLTNNWSPCMIARKGLHGTWYYGRDGRTYFRSINLKYIDPDMYRRIMGEVERENPDSRARTDCADYTYTVGVDGAQYRVTMRSCTTSSEGAPGNWVYRFTTIIPL